MKTGNRCVEDTITTNDIKKLLSVFAEDSIKIASIYIFHCGRTVIRSQDINNAIKFRAMNGDVFWSNLKERLEKAQSMEQNIKVVKTNEKYLPSVCSCVVCENMNGINEKWESWNPAGINKIIKEEIQNGQ